MVERQTIARRAGTTEWEWALRYALCWQQISEPHRWWIASQSRGSPGNWAATARPCACRHAQARQRVLLREPEAHIGKAGYSLGHLTVGALSTRRARAVQQQRRLLTRVVLSRAQQRRSKTRALLGFAFLGIELWWGYQG